MNIGDKARAIDYPVLDKRLSAQLKAITPTDYDNALHYPCRVQLTNGEYLDNVYFIDAYEYVTTWGVWPDEDQKKQEISVDSVQKILKSENRFPLEFVNKVSSFLETGMGYTTFYIVFNDGTKKLALVGSIYDFLQFPDGYTLRDVVDVLQPNQGDIQTEVEVRTSQYVFCLYRNYKN